MKLIANRYRLDTLLGTGGMGTVHRAHDRLTRQNVALKRVTADAQDLDFAARTTIGQSVDFRLALAQEFKTLSSLRHPNVISVLDFGFDNENQSFFTMDYLPQPETILDAGRKLPSNERMQLVIQMLQALSYLHRRNIIHRDLKPDNVLVVNNQVKVLDFGLALFSDEAASRKDKAAGTLAYMAPEVLQSRMPSIFADLYAVGVIIAELFGDGYPFDTTNIATLMLSIVGKEPDLSTLDERLRSIVKQLLAKHPGERPDSADMVIQELVYALDLAMPVESEAIRDSILLSADFIGRQHELDRLRESLGAAIMRQGSAWLVGGESGVGKSRLLDELRTLALVQGVLVVRGNAVEGGGLTYQLWRDVIRRLILPLDIDDFEAGVLKDVVPDIEQIIERPVKNIPRLEGREGQIRLINVMTNILRRQSQPVLLLLEDLQWTQESLEPLKYLVNNLNDLPLMIVASYRSDERPGLPEILPDMQTLILGRMNVREISNFSRSILGSVGRRQEVIDLLHREAEGNIYFMIEVVRFLAEDAGSLSDIGSMTLPLSVFAGGMKEIVTRRLSRVPDHYHELLKYAAVAGRWLDTEVLSAIIASDPAVVLPESDLEHWLAICANAAVIDQQEGRWRFAHDKLREYIVAELDKDECARVHRRVAETVEDLYPDHDELAPLLAYHWRCAGDHVQERHYAVLAANQHFDVGDFNRAVEMYRRVLAITPRDDEANYAAALIRMGQAYTATSDYTVALQHLNQGLELARKIDNPALEGRAMHWIAVVHSYQSDYDNAMDVLDRALPLIRDSGDLDDLHEAVTAYGSLFIRKGEFYLAQGLYRESLDMNRQHDRRAGIASALGGLASVAYFEHDFDQSVQLREEALAIARELGNQYLVHKTLANLGTTLWSRGDFARAQEYVEECLLFSRQSGERWSIASDLILLGYIHLGNGNSKQAQTCLREALQIAVSIQATSLALDILAGFAQIDAKNGFLDTAVELLSLAYHHPQTNADVRHTVEPLLEAYREQLSPEDYNKAVERGKDLDLDAVIQSFLA